MPPVRSRPRSHRAHPYSRSSRGLFDSSDSDSDFEATTGPTTDPGVSPSPSAARPTRARASEAGIYPLLASIASSIAQLSSEIAELRSDLTDLSVLANDHIPTLVHTAEEIEVNVRDFYESLPILVAAQVRRGLITLAEDSGHPTLRAPVPRANPGQGLHDIAHPGQIPTLSPRTEAAV